MLFLTQKYEAQYQRGQITAKTGSMSIVVVKKIHKGIDNRIMIIIDLVKQGRFCIRKREEYAF